MKITFTSKSDLAQAYFPHIHPRSARHKLMQLINDDKVLLASLLDNGYNPSSHSFTPAQVTTIINRLGSPY